MKTLICPSCGCSLVRLGISKDQASAHNYNGKEYKFCCQGCVDLFTKNPEKFLEETDDLVVCPSCLAEKPKSSAVKLNIENMEVHFCRCPHCADTFKKNPSFYLKRLEGTISNEGVLDHEGCCINP